MVYTSECTEHMLNNRVRCGCKLSYENRCSQLQKRAVRAFATETRKAAAPYTATESLFSASKRRESRFFRTESRKIYFKTRNEILQNFSDLLTFDQIYISNEIKFPFFLLKKFINTMKYAYISYNNFYIIFYVYVKHKYYLILTFSRWQFNFNDNNFFI